MSEIPKRLASKTISIDTPNCLEVNLFLTDKDSDDNNQVLLQAWHWFENAWHYQDEIFFFFHQSTACGFISDFSAETAIAWVKEFKFSNQQAA